MKIIKYQKQKQGKYIIQLENGEEVSTYEDLILKYNLLITKNVTDGILKKIEEENKTYEIYFVALKYIKNKVRSIEEVRSYLSKNKYSQEMIDSTVELLKKQGYLNDSMYAKSFVHDKMSFSTDGPLKIRNELRSLEIDSIELEEILSVYTEEIELGKIEKLILKQVRSNHSKSASFLKQKILSSLITLGYHSNLIEQKLYLVSPSSEDEKEIYEREYQKLYRKFSRKYQGKDLEYEIKKRLFQKGFSVK